MSCTSLVGPRRGGSATLASFLGRAAESAKDCVRANPNMSRVAARHRSNSKMCFQSFFMLITAQFRDLASSINDCGNVPTFVSGSPPAGP